ncbi:MAG: 30S ribosomal protein S3 [Synergistetes bacterium]|nr:30S ribosomal protein S3 [Synergistota bacterium]MCX8128076.1 30S ribosomal protein S3 [Synergistota bacterium]MDW8192452.1 30S ribosomal protein S3 [Synergistota bacterium]
MGQKVHPTAFRLGTIKTWDSRWFGEGKTYTEQLHEDIKIRDYLKGRWYHAGISKIIIERIANIVRITVLTARPGLVIGAKGVEIEDARKKLRELTGGKRIFINVQEVKKPEVDAQLVAEHIAAQIEKRVSHRRAMKQAIMRALRAGAKGIKVMCSGRLGGAELARREWYLEGRLPLQTIRADIEYGFAEALTIYGKIGVKVWIFHGEVLPGPKEREISTPMEVDTESE